MTVAQAKDAWANREAATRNATAESERARAKAAWWREHS
jgi:hypothetical protein